MNWHFAIVYINAFISTDIHFISAVKKIPRSDAILHVRPRWSVVRSTFCVAFCINNQFVKERHPHIYEFVLLLRSTNGSLITKALKFIILDQHFQPYSLWYGIYRWKIDYNNYCSAKVLKCGGELKGLIYVDTINVLLAVFYIINQSYNCSLS